MHAHANAADGDPFTPLGTAAGAVVVMDKKLETIVQALQENFNTNYEEFRGEVHVFVQAENIIDGADSSAR